MIVTDARKRLLALMVRDQRVELKNREVAMELHSNLCDLLELKVEVNAKTEQLEADRVENMRLEDAIAELEKESADLDIEMIRLGQKLRSSNKKKPELSEADSVKLLLPGDEKCQFVKTSKQALLRGITGIVLDDRASTDKLTTGLNFNAGEVRPFEISHGNKEPAQIVDELWQEVAKNSTHLAEFNRLFEQGHIVEENEQ